MINVREAIGSDVPAIREIFVATYGTDYGDPRCYDEQQLTRLVYSNDSLTLVAEETESKRVVGTASVDLEAGAYSDLVGEFGRLAVHPEFRQRGVGKLLMSERLARVQDRLQVGLVEARVAQSYSVLIASGQHFAVVGFLPLRWMLRERESLALLVRYFGNSLELRSNHPRIVPEVWPLAHLAMENCSLNPDAIVDEAAPAYPPGGAFEMQELTAEGYASLLRIERGRVRRREIFGPARLHYGMFKLQARNSRYLIAREAGRIEGAIGFTLDPADKSIRVFELISLRDEVIPFLLGELCRSCPERGWSSYIEIDVSAYAPRMQRTLIELGFLPAAYLPALVFHEVERLDVVKMIHLPIPPDVSTGAFPPRAKLLADLVLRQFKSRHVLPRIAQAVHELALFGGLNEEQTNRLAGVCAIGAFVPGEVIFREGEVADKLHLVLHGQVNIALSGATPAVGAVGRGECLGEMSLLTGLVHSATATAQTDVETAVLGHADLAELVRLRPDIGLRIYRNLAVGMGEKLMRSDVSLAVQGGVRV
ncbi:MAG: GNAT family N-acetyltransferase [Isosphaeraceae bacterium]|nr:GNAT family N-acetyltransferase [Isosphaeraceae bacterium]